MEFLKWLVLGLAQGITEFLPVSSSGHLVLLYKIFDIRNDTILISIIFHVATLLSLIVYYFKDIINLIKKPFCKTNINIIIASIPTALIVLILNKIIKTSFNGEYIYINFIITAVILLISSYYDKTSNVTNQVPNSNMEMVDSKEQKTSDKEKLTKSNNQLSKSDSILSETEVNKDTRGGVSNFLSSNINKNIKGYVANCSTSNNDKNIESSVANYSSSNINKYIKGYVANCSTSNNDKIDIKIKPTDNNKNDTKINSTSSNKNKLKNKNEINNMAISKLQAFIVGISQGIACFPGISRSGTTISCGKVFGIEKNNATKFSLLISIPAIIGSLLFEIIDYINNDIIISFNNFYIGIGFIVCFIVGLFSIKLLENTVKNNRLKYFAFYLIILSIVIIGFKVSGVFI